MKIGIITNLYPPYVRGGAEHVIVRTVDGLISQGHDVFVVTAKPKGRDEVTVYPTSAERIYQFTPKNLYFVLDDYKHRLFVRLAWHIIDAFSTQPGRRTEEVLMEERPDLVITHNLKGIGLRIPQFIRKNKIPHMHVVHDLQLIYPSGLLFAGREHKALIFQPIYAVYRAVCKWLMGHPQMVIFPSEYLKGEYVKHGFFTQSRVEVLHNPAPEFTPVQRKGSPMGDLRILFVGQLEEHKGIKFLIDSFKRYEGDAQLIIAGEGTWRKYVEEEAKKNPKITYLGYITIEQMINVFGISDALVVPSLCYENSPTVIYESLQAGIPVIAANIGGVGELIAHGKNGLLFKPGSEQDLLRAITELRQRRNDFFAQQDQIKATVKSYSLADYVHKLVSKARSISRSGKDKDE
jgi:glycosyltransferase involved in cell wall biosynthesis